MASRPDDPAAAIAEMQRLLDTRVALCRRLELAVHGLRNDVAILQGQLFGAIAVLKRAALRLTDLQDDTNIVEDIGVFLVELAQPRKPVELPP